MINCIKSIVLKEYTVFKDVLILKMLNILAICLFLDIVIILRLKIFKDLDASQLALYSLIVIGYITFIQNLKFWQEKHYKTLEAVLATNMSIRTFLIGKIIFPFLISIITIVVNYIILNIGVYFLTGGDLIDIKVLLYTLYVSSVFSWCYGIINGYCMWCASMGMAKLMQYITIAIYIFGLTSIFLYKSSILTLTYINYILLFLGFVSLIFLIKTNKEKAILSLLD